MRRSSTPLQRFERDLRGNMRKYVGVNGQTRAIRDFRRMMRLLADEAVGLVTPELKTLRRDLRRLITGWKP